MRNKIKPWTKDEENLLIKLRESGYTYKEISIEIGRSAASCFTKYKRLTDPKYEEYDEQYRKQYYKDNRDRIVERQKQYNQDNKDQIAEYKKQYYQDNKDQITEQHKQYYQDNKDQILEHQKQYRENNKDQIVEYRENNREYYRQYSRNYHAQNPERSVRKERYDGEFADIQLCHEFYKGISPITGTKDDLQVHHLISIRDNHEFWQSAADEEKINNLILIPKDLHMSYHSWLGGSKIPSTPESFWFFVENIWFDEQENLDSFMITK